MSKVRFDRSAIQAIVATVLDRLYGTQPSDRGIEGFTEGMFLFVQEVSISDEEWNKACKLFGSLNQGIYALFNPSPGGLSAGRWPQMPISSTPPSMGGMGAGAFGFGGSLVKGRGAHTQMLEKLADRLDKLGTSSSSELEGAAELLRSMADVSVPEADIVLDFINSLPTRGGPIEPAPVAAGPPPEALEEESSAPESSPPEPKMDWMSLEPEEADRSKKRAAGARRRKISKKSKDKGKSGSGVAEEKKKAKRSSAIEKEKLEESDVPALSRSVAPAPPPAPKPAPARAREESFASKPMPELKPVALGEQLATPAPEVPAAEAAVPAPAPEPEPEPMEEVLAPAPLTLEEEESSDWDDSDEVWADADGLAGGGGALPEQKVEEFSVEEAEERVEKVLRRKGVVRSYTQMNPGKIFPLLVSIVEAEMYIKLPDLPDVQQVESDQVLEIKESSPYVRIVPVIPGCLISPPEMVVDVREKKVDVEFRVAPQAEGDLREFARVQLWHEELLKDEIPIPCRIRTQTLTRFMSYSSVLTSFAGALLDTYGQNIPALQASGQDNGGMVGAILRGFVSMLSSSGLWLGFFFFLVALGCYWWLRPKRGDVIEKFLTTDLH